MRDGLKEPWQEYAPPQSQSDFPVRFAIFGQSDLRVTVDYYELSQIEFSFAGQVEGYPGFDASAADQLSDNEVPAYQRGTLTLVVAVEDETVCVWREPTPSRTDDIAAGGVNAISLNREFERLWAREQAMADRLGRIPMLHVDGPHSFTPNDAGQCFVA